ncbi:Hypothetical predicted protein [Paramuricea clavata]|uniref:Uncharacterized protein n=1 Tax=Paramuricea clavata TaxID=317549 RepID=A0A6S7I2I3_PARCT|nr:Hypothetical predicted protein [Paramuricea clavata]
MAEQENISELENVVNPDPSTREDSMEGGMDLVQAVVADQDQTGTQNQTLPGVSYDQTGSKEQSNPTVSYDRSGTAPKRGRTPVIRLDDDDHVPAKRVRRSDDVNFDDDVNYELEELETENILSPNSRWEASATLSQFLETAVKRLNKFERKTLVKTYPRPNVDAVYTPAMDEYLKPFIQGVATPDKPHKDLQDSVLDLFGPLCTAYENLLSMESTMTSDGVVELNATGLRSFQECLKHALLLTGDVVARISTNRREVVLNNGSKQDLRLQRLSGKHLEQATPFFVGRPPGDSTDLVGADKDSTSGPFAHSVPEGPCSTGGTETEAVAHFQDLQIPRLTSRSTNKEIQTRLFTQRDCVGARGKRIVDEAGNSSSTIPRGRIYKFYLCGAQEGWGESSSSKSKTPEPVSRLRAFQDGGHPHVKGSIKEGRFSRENRPQGCLPDSANLEKPPKISSVSLEGHHAGVCMPSFRFGDSGKGFYQAYEAGSRGIEAKRYSPNYIFRRYPNYGRISRSSITSCGLNSESPIGARLLVNYQKSQLLPCQEMEFLGFLIDSNAMTLQLPGEKLRKI